MIWSWTLWRYLAIQFATGVLSIYLGFLFLAFSLDVAGLISYTTAHHVPTMIVIGMAILQLPDLGLKLMPFAVLLGGVFAFVRLSRSHELIAVRAAGVSAAKSLTGTLGREIGKEAIQLHGGIGMTWEHEAGHYLKRLTFIDLALGDSHWHLERFRRLSS